MFKAVYIGMPYDVRPELMRNISHEATSYEQSFFWKLPEFQISLLFSPV